MTPLLRATLVLLLLTSGAAAVLADDTTDLVPEAWLLLPELAVPAPAGAGDEAEIDLFDRVSLPLQDWQPSADAELAWPGQDAALRWQRRSTDDGRLTLDPDDGIRLLALYVECDAFVEAELVVDGPYRARVFLDGTQKIDRDGSADEDEVSVDLEPGQHLLIACVAAPDSAAAGTGGFGLWLGVPADRAGQVRLDTDPTHDLMIDELLDMEVVTSLSLSADGAVAAIGMRTPQPPTTDQRTWVEFVSVEDGTVLRSLEGVGTIGGFQWAPAGEGRRYAFTTRDDEATTLWIADFDGGRPAILREGLEDFGSFRWMPDGDGLVYSVTEEGEKDPEHFKRYRDLQDRMAGTRDRSFLYQISVPDGVVRRLTAGPLTTSLQDIAPDGRSLLFTRAERDDAQWPFLRAVLFELDLSTLELRELADVPWGLSAAYDPDGERILITASPSAFGELGEDVPADRIANLYDTQAYLMDRESADVTAISRDFDPALSEVAWSRATGDLLARATVGTGKGLFRYEPEARSWSRLDSPVEAVDRMAVSADGKVIVFQGDSTYRPWSVLAARLDGRWRPREIRRSDLDLGGTIRTGTVEEFDFTSSAGDRIDGHVYYPADYDESRQWPALVYYYGGTSPVTRDFGGRYPKEYWTAHGYVVYVLEPSGATGYGQEFSSRHVNNWGVTVADEIVEGTRAFLEAHSAVDPDRVGCLGASYGGFMTQLLVTRTDIFAAAISHAGISSLSSYWGEGNWGYTYSAAATAHSYPWNRPDLYVDQSPLFSADQVDTPLLLLHGGDDDNVPPGESEQMYTALRVLGKPVEYIRIAGEKHWILEREKRDLWARTIVAWFDRWLKDAPDWYEHLYAVEE